jgi:hypothetical protein
MLTFDGNGHGQSDYWKYSIHKIAKEVGEECSCWSESPFSFSLEDPPFCFCFTEDAFTVKISCKDKKITCRNEFPLTEKNIKKLYKKLYGI